MKRQKKRHILHRRTKRYLILLILLIIGMPIVAILSIILYMGHIEASPNPISNREIINASRVAREDIVNSLEEIEDLGIFRAGSTSYDDRCYEGQNNFKVFQGYAWRCTSKMTKLYAFNGDFKKTMLELHKQLSPEKANSLAGTSYDIPNIIQDYYDVHHWKVGRDRETDYSVSSMPSMHLETKSGNYFVIDAAEDTTLNSDYFQFEYTQEVDAPLFGTIILRTELYNSKKEIKDLLETFEYVLQVKSSKIYWERPYPEFLRDFTLL